MRWKLSTGLIKPLSLNDRHHWAVKAKHTREVRRNVCYAAYALNIPPLQHINVQLMYVPRDNRRRDTDNLWATAKPAIDGLVDAKVVPDDTSEYVTRHEPVIVEKDPRSVECRLWLMVWPRE